MIDVRKLVLAGVLAAGFGVTPRTADASEVFIGILEKKWNISRVPAPSGAAPTGKGCLLCHDREKGGKPRRFTEVDERGGRSVRHEDAAEVQELGQEVKLHEAERDGERQNRQ